MTRKQGEVSLHVAARLIRPPTNRYGVCLRYWLVGSVATVVIVIRNLVLGLELVEGYIVVAVGCLELYLTSQQIECNPSISHRMNAIL